MVRVCRSTKTTKSRSPGKRRAIHQRTLSPVVAGRKAKPAGERTTSRTAAQTNRLATRLRAERLLTTEIGYMYHRSFDKPGADRRILSPPGDMCAAPQTRRAPGGADFYLARLYEVPLLSQEEETHLFRKMNYLKFLADRLRQKLNPRTATVSQLDRIEELQAQAQETRNQIIEANLRLVFSLAKRYANVGTSAFDDFMGEGHVTLMRAVEKFDYSRGVKFSTYATWAVLNGCNALLKKQNPANGKTHHQPVDGVEDCVADHRVTASEESSIQELRRAVGELLLELNSRERAIIEARFGFAVNESPTLKELGEDLGISKERVRQLQQRALQKLRALADRQKMEFPDHCGVTD